MANSISSMASRLLQLNKQMPGLLNEAGLSIGNFKQEYTQTGENQRIRLLLNDPMIDCAVYKCNSEKIIKMGLGLTHYDFGVITEIDADTHENALSEKELRSLSALVEGIRPTGWLILNAKHTYPDSILKSIKCNTAYFSTTDQSLSSLHKAKNNTCTMTMKDRRLLFTDNNDEQTIFEFSSSYKLKTILEHAFLEPLICVALLGKLHVITNDLLTDFVFQEMKGL
jgi:hypothetical protein